MSNIQTYASNWHTEFISCNLSPDDQNTRLNAYYVGQHLYFHFMLMGGSPGDKITVNVETVMNDQVTSVITLDVSIGNGSPFYVATVPNVAGKLEVRLYYKNERGERFDLQGAYAYVQNNPVNKQDGKKKNSHGFMWLVLLGVLLFLFYLASNNKIPGLDFGWFNRTTASTSSSSSSSASAKSSSGSSVSSSVAKSGNRLAGTTWKYTRDVGSYVTFSFSNDSCTSNFVNTITGDRRSETKKYTVHGNKIDCELIGENVIWEIKGSQLIFTVEGEAIILDRQ